MEMMFPLTMTYFPSKNRIELEFFIIGRMRSSCFQNCSEILDYEDTSSYLRIYY